MKRICFCLFIPFVIIACGLSVQASYNVKDFGAKGDGKTNDTKAILDCIRTAIKNNGTVVIPFGKYKIDTSLLFNLENHSLTIEGIIENGNRPIIFTNEFTDIIKAVSDINRPNGILTIKNLELKGNNIPYSDKHPYYDGNYYHSGVVTYNLKNVTIVNNRIVDIYGDGINIRNLKGPTCKLSDRASVLVKSNKIINCWGLNPTTKKNVPNYKLIDEYGDGIYITNAIGAIIEDNYVVNDLKVTKQFGRAGVVLEYNAEDCIIRNNEIFGYDRNIHLEADLGGHLIINNKITGSDIGVFVYNVPDTINNYTAKPIMIQGNYISNENVPPNIKYPAIRGKGERALISFMVKGKGLKGSKIYNNKLYVYKQFPYLGNTLERIYADSVKFKGNVYKAIGYNNSSNLTTRPYVYLDRKTGEQIRETYDGVLLRFNLSNVDSTHRRTSDNKFLNGAKANLPFIYKE